LNRSASLIRGRNGRFRSRPYVRGLLLAAATCAALAHPGRATAGVRIYSADEVLSEWTFSSGGHLFFRDPDGGLYEFITDINDADILNHGRGDFFAADMAMVREAVDAVDYPFDACDMEVFILPYPRRGLLVSSAGDRSVYLSPGVVPYADVQVHALIAHEMGHVVHHQLLPEKDRAGWERYRALRSIQNAAVYNETAPHRNRPHEIFAEDFRYLFGGDLATYSGSIENNDLPLPTDVAGLKSFFLSLGGRSSTGHELPVTSRLHIFPNPTRGYVNIGFAAGSPATAGPFDVRIYDVQGRLVADQHVPSREPLTWEGRLADGSNAPPGLYYVHVSGDAETWVGKVLIAR